VKTFLLHTHTSGTVKFIIENLSEDKLFVDSKYVAYIQQQIDAFLDICVRKNKKMK
jgi:hypothetical protein